MAGPLFELEQEYGSIFGGMMKRKVKGKSPKTEESKSVRSGLINNKIVHCYFISLLDNGPNCLVGVHYPKEISQLDRQIY